MSNYIQTTGRKKPHYRIRRSIVSGAFLTLLLISPTSAQNEPPSFDRFMGGLLACKFNDAFNKFHKGIYERFGNEPDATAPQVNLTARVSAPAELAAFIHIDRAVSTFENGTEWTSVTIPVTGKFAGLPMRSINFALGNGNGVNSVEIEFTSTKEEVRARLGDLVELGERLITVEPGPEISVGISKDRPAIFCDDST